MGPSRFGVQNVVVVSSAEAAEELLRHKDAEFCDRQTAMSRSAGQYVGLDGIAFPFANYNVDYKLQRKVAMTEYFTTASMKSYEKLRTQEVSVMVEKVFSLIESNPNKNEDLNHMTSQSPTATDIRLVALASLRNILFS
ncbi:unnamed protein product [Calypogeia fissa]